MKFRCIKNLRGPFLVALGSLLLGACHSKQFVNDKAHILDAVNSRQLDRMLQAYHGRTSCSIYVYTINKLPEGEDASGYTRNLADELGLRQQALDNSAIIFVALQDKKVILQPEFGLEWQIDAGISELIVRDLQMYFGQGLYNEGILRAAKQIIALTDKLSWKIRPFGKQVNATQDIVALRNFQVEQKGSDSIALRTPEGSSLSLFVTRYMDDLTKKLPASGPAHATVYYRPVVHNDHQGYVINIVAD